MEELSLTVIKDKNLDYLSFPSIEDLPHTVSHLHPQYLHCHYPRHSVLFFAVHITLGFQSDGSAFISIAQRGTWSFLLNDQWRQYANQ